MEATPGTRHVKVVMETIAAWEEWIVEVPADATVEWITANLGDCDFIGMDESGNSGAIVVDVEEL